MIKCILANNLNLNVMNALTNIWSTYTAEFSTIQKVIIAIVLTFIVSVAFLAIVLLFLEITG